MQYTKDQQKAIDERGRNILVAAAAGSGKTRVLVERIMGHGGFFKTKGVGTKIAAAAINAPVSVMETASEGGAWGIALLAAYMDNKNGKSLSEYLSDVIFKNAKCENVCPTPRMLKALTHISKNTKQALRSKRQQ